jgi:hypothetical protein
MDESISQIYYQRIETDKNPVAVLVSLLAEVLEKDPSTFDYQRVGKLVKLYGKRVVFEGILILATSDIDSSYQVYNYLGTICRRLFMEANTVEYKPVDLTPKARKILEKLHGRSK